MENKKQKKKRSDYFFAFGEKKPIRYVNKFYMSIFGGIIGIIFTLIISWLIGIKIRKEVAYIFITTGVVIGYFLGRYRK